MKKSFLAGIVFLMLVSVVSIVLDDWNLIIKISGGIGLLAILASGLFVGAFVSGDRMRANFSSETKEDRSERLRTVNILLLFGLPNLAAAVVCYMVTT
ncbi:hypothetical protein C0966_16555 [Bacillus methanolicus]|uniref:DUF5316 domain-containing protein n=1 Tax=Bacillus methanolicus TaxID=1471 RepID=UPI00237FD9A8|nr:DUF5316 domain-containing protein [Bacillus methanolicus]MDE3840883.1 hypothetical protein [Bacillus methanolicus]